MSNPATLVATRIGPGLLRDAHRAARHFGHHDIARLIEGVDTGTTL